MKNIKVSLRYAKSLISLSIKNKLLEKIKVDLDLIQSFDSNVEFKNLLKSPIIKNEKKNKYF
jgi:F0F1-type ATP synthase delta subunit